MEGSAVGGGVSGPGTARPGYGPPPPSLAIDLRGRPVIAWQHSDIDGKPCCDAASLTRDGEEIVVGLAPARVAHPLRNGLTWIPRQMPAAGGLNP